jgi:AbrB family looped-hinge helix DNA binding protein
MSMITARISASGQLTLPKKVRQALAVKAGQRVMFQIAADGVLLKSLGPSSAETLAGSLRAYAISGVSSHHVRELVQEDVAHAAAQEG